MSTYKTVDQWCGQQQTTDPPRLEDFQHSYTVWIAWGKLESVLSWCRSQCRGSWAWRLSVNNTVENQYVFYFSDERDCAAFVLTWC